jgi:hypothetical protein
VGAAQPPVPAVTPTGAAVVAVVVALLAAISTPVGLWMSSRARSQEKVEDWARQDLVAERAATAAEKVAKVAQALQASNATNARVAADTAVKLDDIQRLGAATHALVDGNLTKAMQSEMAAHVLAVTMMLRDVETTRAAGAEPNPDLLAALESSRTLINELGPLITDRVEQDKATKLPPP